MTYKYNDGGRAASGRRGRAGDCVCRALCIATGIDYAVMYKRLAEGNASQRQTAGMHKTGKGVRTASHGIYTKRQWFKDLMAELGFRWVPLVGFGEQAHTLNEFTRFEPVVILKLRRHYAAMIDGVINDTFDSGDNGTAKVFGYWVKDA